MKSRLSRDFVTNFRDCVSIPFVDAYFNVLPAIPPDLMQPPIRFPRATLCVVGLIASLPALPAQSVSPALAPEVVAQPRFEVVGHRDRLPGIGGSANIVGENALTLSQPFTAAEALRRVPGVQVRDEEGFGLRPNIGVRGLNPTRTTKLTLLEDGLPLAYAPYGDNASYYHPPIDRYAGFEVLKGAHALFFGPQTIGGVINYLTPDAPATPGGFVQLTAGNRSFFNGHLRVGGHGALLDVTRKQGDGARDNLDHALNDLNAKYTARLGDHHTLTLRANYYTEDSTVTYSGLTEAEFARLGARYNPFKNDEFDITRHGLSLTHRAHLPAAAQLTTSAYFSHFDRDWWRQSSNSQDGQHGAGSTVVVIDGVSATFLQHRLAGRRVNPDTQFANAQGRLRTYDTYGLESRLALPTAIGELQTGVKLHQEEQARLQINGSAPTARTGNTVENNARDTLAWSAFAAHRFDFGPLTFTPVTRYEAMEFERLNRLNGVGGRATLDRVLPGLGATWRATERTNVFASVHRGFAPPRVEDLVGGAGTVTDVNAEKSLNSELGVRFSTPEGAFDVQAAVFRHDFDNLIAVGSIAGGGTPLAEGKALFEGLELGASAALPAGFRARLAYTNLNTASQETPFLNIATRTPIPGSAAGRRQPYAPRHTATAALAYTHDRLDAEIELQHIGEQVTDFANTVAPTPDGQRGLMASSTVWNASLRYRLTSGISVFTTVKNLADLTYIVDRTRGIQVGQPRLIHAGVRYTF